MSFIITKRF